MPHFGHRPGSSEPTSGHIGQMKAAPAAAAVAPDDGAAVGLGPSSTGTNRMPQMGQSPGRSET
jgi:hypothetical protein